MEELRMKGFGRSILDDERTFKQQRQGLGTSGDNQHTQHLA